MQHHEESVGVYVLDEFPWISCILCVPHVASLLMKDVASIDAISTLTKNESAVVSWFSNHRCPLATLRQKVQQILGHSCELVKAGATRFETNNLVGQRLMKLRGALQQTVMDPAYVAKNYKDATDERRFRALER